MIFSNKNNIYSQSYESSIRIIPLGGAGNVTKNMYVYEYRRKNSEITDILIVDCGIGFPDEDMYGIDLIIPDISYLKDKKGKIRGIVLTHGHDDHIGALPYILPEIQTPIYATKLTSAFAENKLKEFGLHKHINQVNFSDNIKLGNFSIDFVYVTHSVPDSANLIIKTPLGIFYHGSDFKFDWTPIDNRQTEVAKIAQAAKEGILCLLSDCVRVESPGNTLSERNIETTLEAEIRSCNGKFIFTTQSSNISRIQQAINVAVKNNRRIAFLGRSIEQNVEIARKLGYLNFPDVLVVSERELKKYNPKDLALIVTGSQAQPHSALSRIAEREHKFVNLKKGDVVVFSADPIPGYENAVHNLIDQLTVEGAKVSYSEITDNLHVSGHGSENDLALMIGLTKPKHIIPIGGTYRQMHKYSELAQKMGFNDQQIILPQDGEVISFDNHQKAKITDKLQLKNIMVDGLGIGDVGNVVLRDRQTMASDGIVIAIVPIEQSSGQLTADPDIISRGFVYMKQSVDLIDNAKNIIRKTLNHKPSQVFDWQFIKKRITDSLEEFLYKETHRRPLVLTMVIKV
jgi:ribonuclease J